jgi:hypothetical protein
MMPGRLYALQITAGAPRQRVMRQRWSVLASGATPGEADRRALALVACPVPAGQVARVDSRTGICDTADEVCRFGMLLRY